MTTFRFRPFDTEQPDVVETGAGERNPTATAAYWQEHSIARQRAKTAIVKRARQDGLHLAEVLPDGTRVYQSNGTPPRKASAPVKCGGGSFAAYCRPRVYPVLTFAQLTHMAVGASMHGAGCWCPGCNGSGRRRKPAARKVAQVVVVARPVSTPTTVVRRVEMSDGTWVVWKEEVRA